MMKFVSEVRRCQVMKTFCKSKPVRPHSSPIASAVQGVMDPPLPITILDCDINRFYAIGSVYGITTISASVGQIKSAVWSKFTETESFVMFV